MSTLRIIGPSNKEGVGFVIRWILGSPNHQWPEISGYNCGFVTPSLKGVDFQRKKINLEDIRGHSFAYLGGLNTAQSAHVILTDLPYYIPIMVHCLGQ